MFAHENFDTDVLYPYTTSSLLVLDDGSALRLFTVWKSRWPSSDNRSHNREEEGDRAISSAEDASSNQCSRK